MKRHRFNIFPEAKNEDYQRLKQDIADNGFDKSQPIILYEGDILDGWNRQRACDELGIELDWSFYEVFQGTDEEAIAFMMRTNKRRNLNSGQWSCIAVEAEELVAAIRQAASRNKGGRPKKTEQKPPQKIGEVSKHSRESEAKTAQLFNTNRTYVNQANRLKTEAPEVFEAVKAGSMRMTDATKAVRAIPKDPWRKDERDRRELCKSGESVVANASKDQNLIQWAESKGLAVRIDRGTVYGNPFVLDKDGDRDQVCESYRLHYLPHKPSILNSIQSLKGKVLICHCYPEKCHGNCLCDLANNTD